MSDCCEGVTVIIDGVRQPDDGSGIAENLTTAEVNTDLVLHPDGVGGVAWGVEIGPAAQFQTQLFVGSATSIPFANVANVFATIQLAIDFINGLAGAAAPSFTNKFIIEDFDSLTQEEELFLPDWVWLRGRGQDNTFIAESAASGDYIISVGVGGLIDISVIVGLIAGDNYSQMVQVRDSQSLYSPLQEPFAITGGETLDFRIDGSVLTTITFQAGDTSAAAVAARIGADPDLLAVDSFGRVRIRGDGFGQDVLLELLGTGTANTIFGWPAAGASTLDPATELEFRVIKDVQIFMVGVGAALKYAVSVEDVSSTGTFVEGLRVQGATLFSGGMNGLRFAGGLLNIINPEFRTTGVACDLYNDGISPLAQQELVLIGGLFLDSVNAPTHIRFNAPNIAVTAAASSYDPQKVRSGTSSQPTNITGVTIDLYSEDTPFGTDGVLSFTVAGTLLTWEAPGETVAGPAVNVGAGGSFTLTADGGSTMDITVAAGSLPGTDQTDINIEVFQTRIDPLTQAGSIKFADRNAFFGPPWQGRNAEAAIAQLGVEIRETYIAGGDASIGGVAPGSAAEPGNIGGFPSMVYTDVGDRLALWPGKFPNVAAIGDRPVSLIIHTVAEATPGVGTDVKFDVEAKYVDDGDDVSGASSESLTTTFTLGTVNLRNDISIALDNGLLAGDQQLRFEITRDVSVAQNANVKVHITGVTIRG